MKNRFFVSFWLILLLILPIHLSFAGENKQAVYKAALQEALDVTDIFSGRPLRLRATFRLFSSTGVLDGNYAFTGFPNGNFREDITTKDFAESIVHNTERFISRSADFEPLPIAELRQLIYLAHSPLDAETITKISADPQNSANKCYASERGLGGSVFSGYEACFNEGIRALSSVVASFNTDWHRLEYSDFSPDGKKVFPRTMRRIHNGKLVAEVKVNLIDHDGFDLKLLDPPPNASKRDSCRKFKAVDASFEREYFEIRSKYKSGSVVIAGSLDEHGRIGKTEIQQSAGSPIDEAALKALTQLHLNAAKCDGHAVPSKFRLHIWFSPAPHPDHFESFRDDADAGMVFVGRRTPLDIIPAGTIYESNHR